MEGGSLPSPPGADADRRALSLAAGGSWLDRRLASAFVARLERIAEGTLELRGGHRALRFGRPAPDGLAAALEIRDPRCLRRIATGGSLGAAEAYLDGLWESPDLVALVRLFARNRAALEGLEGGWARLGRWPAKALHALRANTRRGSRANIEAHYDLGNDFFALFLDESMTYSAALFERPEATLEEAQTAKIDRLCRLLRLGPGDHLLEIGTGWGALAIHAASRYGCRVTTTTISRAQRAAARERIAAAGLAGRIELLDRDYRDLEGTYSRIVSVEMVEAVGLERLPGFFAVLDRRLAPGGLAAIQSITIAERFYEGAKAGVDFIQRHVFPGGAIPSLGALLAAAAGASRMTPVEVADLGPDYARTLALWSQRFEANLERVRGLGFDERFVRLWRYYLAYCEAGFLERALSDAQILFAGPEYRGPVRFGGAA